MKKYIVLLRGINVSGKNKIPMITLRELLNDLEFQNVQTYIQSGNIILTSEQSKLEVSKRIKKGILQKFDLDIHVIVKTVLELNEIVKNYPFSLENEKIVAFTFLDKISDKETIEVENIGEDLYKIVKDVVYLNCKSGFGKTKLTNNVLEKKLNVNATTRNLKTTLKLAELAK
ncbi:DUF1697 domain-containing protein [Polaribacter sp. KT 15]|uniref:DUF1697 domain-containing protein n=1 Tax=Polaribacter sp. KT 15 TaxID=1896175 RepID=UPI0009099FA2|nr:DUF1697 domain-containing protein [Polaribacter sp. KT 15]SHM76935.1 Uncharacterized conserved protein, DUF1697 family [Polaribacter sp. KT 15]